MLGPHPPGGGAAGGAEQRGQGIGRPAVDLLRHQAVLGAEAGLDVHHRDPQLGRGQRATQGRVGVSDHHGHAGLVLPEQRLQPSHDAGGLVGVAPGPDLEEQVGRSHPQLLVEQGVERVVVVLSGVDRQHREVGSEFLAEDAGFDDLGASTVAECQVAGWHGQKIADPGPCGDAVLPVDRLRGAGPTCLAVQPVRRFPLPRPSDAHPSSREVLLAPLRRHGTGGPGPGRGCRGPGPRGLGGRGREPGPGPHRRPPALHGHAGLLVRSAGLGGDRAGLSRRRPGPSRHHPSPPSPSAGRRGLPAAEPAHPAGGHPARRRQAGGLSRPGPGGAPARGRRS